MRRGVLSYGGNCLSASPWVPGVSQWSVSLWPEGQVISMSMCVEGRGGHFSEVVSPKLVVLFGLMTERAMIRSVSQAPQPALANAHDPETGTPNT